MVAYSGALRRTAVELGKIATDLRLLSMGPRAGIAEIILPAVQPGSSIMPGKVNPSIPEMVNQVCFQVFGCDTTIMTAGEAGELDLNVMMPVIAWNALHAQRILTNAMKTLRERTVDGIKANRERARELLDRSTAMATALSPYIGYAATADLAKTSVATGRTIRELALERGLLTAADLDRILSVEAMTRPGIPRKVMKRHLFLVALVCAAAASIAAQSSQRPQSHGRLFPPEDLGLLEAPDRDIWQHPEQIMDVLGIAEGSVVADIGAGAGWFTIRLARRVGPNGVVYAEDVQPQMLAAIQRRVKAEGLMNVRPILGKGSDPQLPRGALDVVLMVDAYHEIDDRVPMLRNLGHVAAFRWPDRRRQLQTGGQRTGAGDGRTNQPRNRRQ